jgi:hypothetical protein
VNILISVRAYPLVTITNNHVSGRVQWQVWDIVAAGIFFGMTAIYLALAIHLMGGLDFSDETEKYIAALLLTKGYAIYSDIFVQHGPTSYMFSHLFHLVFGFHGLSAPRAIPIALSLLAVLSVVGSPALTRARFRFLAGSVLVAGFAAAQAIFALVQTMYQVYAGYLFIIAFTIFLIPLIVGAAVRPWHAVVAGLCLSLIFFCAFSFAPAIFFYCLICWLRWFLAPTGRLEIARLMQYGIAGAAVGIGLVLTWLLAYGSVPGYFVLHIYFNLTVYSVFLAAGVNPFLPLYMLVPGLPYFAYRDPHIVYLADLYSHWFTHLFLGMPTVYALLLVWIAKKAKSLGERQLGYVLLAILVDLCFVYVSPRLSLDFACSTIVLAMCGVSALTSAILIERSNRTPRLLNALNVSILLGVLLSFCIAQFNTKTWLYDLSPFEYYQRRGQLETQHTPEMEFVRSVVGPQDGILVLPFDLKYYIWTERAPAFGIFYWMPWQNLYAKKPVAGFPFNLCQQLAAKPPKAIIYSDNPIWGRPTDSFLGCVKSTLKAHYLRATNVKWLWVRADIAAKQPHVLASMLVPIDFNVNSVSPVDRPALEAARIQLGSIALGQTCIRTPAVMHEPVIAGACTEPQNFDFGLLPNSEGYKVVAVGNLASQVECLEITGASVEDGAPTRFWPCQEGARNQIFSKEPGTLGVKLKALNSGLCLAPRKGRIVQTNCAAAPEWTIR